MANLAFYSISGGLIGAGLNLLRQLRYAEKTGEKVDWGEVIFAGIEGALLGTFFGFCGMLAVSMSSALIFIALGCTSLIFAVLSLVQAKADWENGDYDLVLFDAIFAGLGFGGAYGAFKAAGTCSSASETAGTSTDTSTDNTNTTENNSGSSNNNSSGNGNNNGKRPTWRQSELDARNDFSDYREQVSFKDGQEVQYGTKGSVRPDFYKDGASVDIKNYNVQTQSGRTNLARNIENQYFQRLSNLPEGTQQSVLIDVRGQNVSEEVLQLLYDDIMIRTDNGISVSFKTN